MLPSVRSFFATVQVKEQMSTTFESWMPTCDVLSTSTALHPCPPARVQRSACDGSVDVASIWAQIDPSSAKSACVCAFEDNDNDNDTLREGPPTSVRKPGPTDLSDGVITP